jgi:hypothetical protein
MIRHRQKCITLDSWGVLPMPCRHSISTSRTKLIVGEPINGYAEINGISGLLDVDGL